MLNINNIILCNGLFYRMWSWTTLNINGLNSSKLPSYFAKSGKYKTTGLLSFPYSIFIWCGYFNHKFLSL